MRRRKRFFFLVLCLVLGMLPVTALAAEGNNSTPIPGENISTDLKLNDWYDLDLQQHFTDPDGDMLVFEVSADGKNWMTADPSYAYYPAGTGIQQAFFRAVDARGNVSEPLTLTATVAAPPSSVTVTLSISNGTNGFAYCGETDTVMMPVTLTVPYFDLGLYDLERYYYNPLCYSTHKEGDTEYENSQQPGTQESAGNIVTLMHVFIYATERYYLGYDAADCGKGVTHEDGTLEEAISWTGNAGSSYMMLWDHGTNLNYYVDWEYPLGAHKWGSTSDQIALYGGEIITGHMIASSGTNGTNFSFISVDGDLDTESQTFDTTVRRGQPLELTLVRALEDYSNADSTTLHVPDAGRSLYYCKESNVQSSLKGSASKWIKLDGVTDENGKFIVDTTELEPGIYYVVAEGVIDGQKEVAPALIRVTVKQAPEAALEITQNGKTVPVKTTGLIYNDVNVYFAELSAFDEYTIKDGLSGNGTRRQFTPLNGTNLVGVSFPVEVTNWEYWSGKADIESIYGSIDGLDSKDTVLQAFRVSALNDRMQPSADLYVLVVEMPVTHVAKVTLNETAISMVGGQSRQLTASLTPGDTSFPEVTWTTSDSEIVEVTEDGVITGYTAGTAIVTATADGVSASCTVTITKSYPRPTVIATSSEWPAKDTNGKLASITKVTMHDAAAKEIFTSGGNYYIHLDEALFAEKDKLRLVIDYQEDMGKLTIEIDDVQVVDAARGTGSYTHQVTLTDGKWTVKIEGINKGTNSVSHSVVFATDGIFEIAPMLKGASSNTTVLFRNEPYKIDLEKIFRNTGSNPMTFTVSLDDGEAVAYTEEAGIAMDTAGSHTLKFYANNGNGNSPVYTVTAQVLDEASVQQVNFPVQGGTIEWFAFTDADRKPLPENTTYLWDPETTTMTINLPMDYDKLGKVMTFYKLIKDDPNAKLPLLSGSTLTAGAGTKWDEAVRNNQTNSLNNGDVNAYVYLFETSNRQYTTIHFNYVRVKPDTYFEYKVTGNSSYTITGDIGGVNGHSWMDDTKKYEVHVALTEDTPLDAELACIERSAFTTLTDGFGQYAWNTDNVFGTNPEHWVIRYKIDKFPMLAQNQAATGSAIVPALKPFQLDLDTIFSDPDEADTLTYQVKFGDGAWSNNISGDYTYVPANADVYTLTFRAFDGFVYSEDTYTVTLTATNSDVFYDVTVQNLPEDAGFFINKGFGEDGHYLPGDALTAAYAGGIHTVKVPMNVSSIAMEVGQAWTTVTVDPEGGAENTFAMQETLFDVRTKVDADAEGAVTVKNSAGNTVAGENNVFYLISGEAYDAAANPTGDFTASWTNGAASYTVTSAAQNTVKVKLEVRSPKTITLDADATVRMVYQNGYYVLYTVKHLFSVDNGDGTITYTYSCPNGQYYANGYMYFAEKEGHIDKAGYLMNANDVVLSWEGDTRPENYRGEYPVGAIHSSRQDDSVMVNVNDRNHLVLDVGENFRLLSFRIWEIINTDTENVMIEPEFTYTNYDESMISMVSANEKLAEKGKECGTGGNNWMDMTVLKPGTTFLEVGYNAVEIATGYSDGSWGGAAGQSGGFTYNAVDPARTALVVIQTDGNAAEDVSFGIRCFSSNVSGDAYDPLKAVPWDVEFDTLYFVGDHGELEFSPSALSGIQNVAVSYDKGASFRTLTGEKGVYTMNVYSGNNIIRVTNGYGQTAYQVVRGDKISYTIRLAKDANKNGTTDPGDTVRVQFHGIHMPIGKMSGIYNPGYGYGHKVTYEWNDAFAQNSYGPQYSFVTDCWIEVVIDPDYKADQYLTDGYINFNVYGDAPGNHRNLGENGRPVNTTAASSNYTRCILPDILVYEYTGSGEEILLGDLNEDGKIALADVNLLIDAYRAKKFEAVGDMDEDDKITLADVNLLIDIYRKKG